MPNRVAVFVGTRPEAVKLASVVRELERSPVLEPLVVSTGQHREMLRQVVDLFDLPVHEELDCMVADQTLAGLTSVLLARVDAWLERERPDFALVQGDTTTVLAAALACFYRGVPLGHVEAGLRTGDLSRPFPEEANRKLVAPLARLHFAPTETARQSLLAEGISDERVLVTGNTVIDALQLEVAAQDSPAATEELDALLVPELGPSWREQPYVLVTGHRRESFGRGFEEICAALETLAIAFPLHRFVYPVHLNPRVRGPVHDRLGHLPNVRLLAPLAYRPFVALMRHARLVLTDSGGVQEEAPSLGRPVLVMRDTTERPEGVAAGTARLVGADRGRIVAAVAELLKDEDAWNAMARAQSPYGDGHAAERIVGAVTRLLAPAAPLRRLDPGLAATG